jgi:predicted nucleotidyltransferase
MDKSEAYAKVTEYAKRVRKAVAVKDIVMFGSYVNGVPREDSDIDVAVIVDKIDGDFFDASLRLYRLRRDVDERIEPVLLEADNDKSGFLSAILRNGRIVS